MDREAWLAAVHGVTKSRTQLSDFTHSLKLGKIFRPFKGAHSPSEACLVYTSILGSVLGNSGVTATCRLPGRPRMEGNIHNTSSGVFAVLSPQSCEGSPPDLGLVSLLLLETQGKI